MHKSPAVVLMTFGGRQDRMELLKHYAEQAMHLGIIDEWHVWNCARSARDAKWLPNTFQAIRATADDRNYQLAYHRVPVAPVHTVSFDVRAAHNAHIAFIPDGGGETYEIILGGWGNSWAGCRVWPPGTLPEHTDSELGKPDLVCAAPGVMSARLWRHVDIELTRTHRIISIIVRVDQREVLRYDALDPTPRPFNTAVMSGFGTVAEWRFETHAKSKTGLFYPTLDKRYHPWNPVYRFYAERGGEYADTVFIKCDDDIVYMDLERLSDFIRFRRQNPEYFLLSANVVNNGVCAYIQQQLGILPFGVAKLEMPPGGLKGSLWESGEKATAVHNYFLANADRFRRCGLETFAVNTRISINCIAWLGQDLPSFDSRFLDDEFDLTVTLPNFLDRGNAIYLPFVASHLSFRPQDADMDIPAILDGYRALALAETAAVPVRAAE